MNEVVDSRLEGVTQLARTAVDSRAVVRAGRDGRGDLYAWVEVMGSRLFGIAGHPRAIEALEAALKVMNDER